MKLSETIITYRKRHDLSQRRFASKCGLTNGTISMIESELNPQTGKKMQPSLPTLKCIANGMGISLHELLKNTDDLSITLGEYEELQEPKKRDYGFAEPKTSGFASVPLIDGIAAGSPIIAQENIVDYYPATVRHPDEYFALYVRGDSMTGAGIPDGSRVLIHKQNYAENGQIVACRVNGDEATLKRFRQAGDTVVLMPENPVYEPIIVPASEFQSGNAEILGVLKQAIVDFE